MAPTHSADAPLTPEEASQLLDVARRAVAASAEGGAGLVVDAGDYPRALLAPGASFVTLRRRQDLRGCMGTLLPRRPLVEDVAANAHAAACRDPRFPPLRRDELDGLDVQVSVLSRPEPMRFTSEADLLRQIRPGVDGLLLEDGQRVGTLLPSVWESLPDPAEFLRALKRKAGLRADEWPPAVRVSRYGARSIPSVASGETRCR